MVGVVTWVVAVVCVSDGVGAEATGVCALYSTAEERGLALRAVMGGKVSV